MIATATNDLGTGERVGVTGTEANRVSMTRIIITGGTAEVSGSTAVDNNRSYFSPIFLDECHYLQRTFRNEFVPAHRRKNPFEYQIFDSIQRKHEVHHSGRDVNNITFKRVNFRGFM